MIPISGSVYGGTDITIQGKGFHNDTDIQVGKTKCDKHKITYAEIICFLGSTEQSVEITNQGTHLSIYVHVYYFASL